MATTDTKVDELIINTLTKAQYDDLVANNQVEANQLYLTKDEDYYMQIDVTYGTTTYAQITSALGAKQEPVCNYNSYQYTYAGNDGTYYYFTCAINNEIKYVRVNSANTWNNGAASLQTTISDLGTIRANASLGASAVQPGDLATVATTGNYNDLSNKPTIPTVNNATLTIQKNGTNVSTFTANASANVTCNITVPTKVSDLTNDSGFITGITANNVTTALGYTPYNSSNPSGYTSNTGTVTSVRVQAGTGLSSSTSTAQNTTLNTTISIASGYKLPTTTEWSNKQDALPSQSGQSGKFLTTNGSTMSWADASVKIDNSTITKNGSDQIQTVGYKDVRTSNTLKTWTGTRAQYDAIVTKDANTLYNITDDTDTTAAMLELLYPVGAVYIGTMDVCPLATLGIGSWEKIASDQVLQGSSLNHNAGTTIAAGLPNITGSINRPGQNNTSGDSTTNYLTGSFYFDSSTYSRRNTSESGTGYLLKFDASRSNSIYGNSSTVQPPAFVVNIWRRIS